MGEDPKTGLGMAHKDRLRWLLPLACLVVVLGHFSSWSASHTEGDELVYRALADQMHWDLTGYTTAADARVSRMPSDIYRAPLFIHPPLWPLLLKVLGALGDPVALGLTLLLGVHLALVLLLGRVAGWLRLDALPRAAVVLLAAVCPVFTFSTTRLHLDALTALLSLALLWQLARLLDLPQLSVRPVLVAALTWALAGNAKLTAILLVPLVVAVGVVLWRSGKLTTLPRWLALPVLACALVAVQHPLRLWGTYGSLLPDEWSHFSQPQNAFVREVLARTRLEMLAHLPLLLPATLVFLWPPLWRALRTARLTHGMQFLFAAHLWLALGVFALSFNQERYWAPFLPGLYLALGLALQQLRTSAAPVVPVAVGLTLLTSATSSFLITQVHDHVAKIVPALVLYVPGLQAWFG